MAESKACQIFVRFKTAEDFEEIIQGEGPDRGLFVPIEPSCGVGRQASIWISVVQFQATGNLCGTVLWRRLRPGGKALPAGQFITLEAAELRHLDRLVDYLKRAPESHSRRNHERYPFVTRATLSAFNRSYSATTRNISERGAQIILHGTKLLPGQDIDVQLQLGHAIGASVALKSVVAWSEASEKETVAGLTFRKDDRELARLAGEIERVRQALRNRWVRL